MATRSGNGRYIGGLGELLHQRLGRLADEHGEAMHRLRDRRLERRDLRAALFEARACLLDVDAADETGLRAESGQLQDLALRVHVGAQEREPLLCRSQLHVDPSDLAGQRHLHGTQIVDRRHRVGLGSGDRGARSAEDVRLPARVETGRDRQRTSPRIADARARTHRRQQRGARDLLLRSRLSYPRFGRAHVGASLQRLFNQVRERRVTKRLPPCREVRRRRRCVDAGRGASPRVRDGGRRLWDGDVRGSSSARCRRQCHSENQPEGPNGNHVQLLICWTCAARERPSREAALV
ncbi:MAG: hypothetical protein QM736_30130 [Vicinamibacterales bacterium]